MHKTWELHYRFAVIFVIYKFFYVDTYDTKLYASEVISSSNINNNNSIISIPEKNRETLKLKKIFTVKNCL